MTKQDISSLQHDHVFLGADHRQNEKKVWLVIGLTASMMIIEIAAGSYYGSMALVADGWHMSTHAAAMLIAALAYRYARTYAHDPRFSFGTGKIGDLAGFASAIILAMIAVLIGWESLSRLMNPIAIGFQQAIAVASAGLLVNLASAWLLKDDHTHHGHYHDHDGHHSHGADNNMRAAYVHVLADALTSVLAIVALFLGRTYGWLWADPLIGVVGAVVIARWSWSLIKSAGGVLLDSLPDDEDLPSEIRSIIEADGSQITDLHVWQVGPGHHSAIVALASKAPKSVAYYREKLSSIHDLSHVTIEVAQLSGDLSKT